MFKLLDLQQDINSLRRKISHTLTKESVSADEKWKGFFHVSNAVEIFFCHNSTYFLEGLPHNIISEASALPIFSVWIEVIKRAQEYFPTVVILRRKG